MPGMDTREAGAKGGRRNTPKQRAQRAAPKPGAGRPKGSGRRQGGRSDAEWRQLGL